MRAFYILFITLLTTIAFAQEDVLIKNGTLLTITNGDLESTDILIRNGKIAHIGKNISAPKAKMIDAAGLFVMPGIIDAHSHMAVEGGVNEYTNPISAEVRIKDAIEYDDVFLYRALAGGVTTINAMHGSANVIGGQNATLKLRYGKKSEDLIFKNAPQTLKFALGENPTRVHGKTNSVIPRTRMGVEQFIRDNFTKAVEYKNTWSDFKNGKIKIQPKRDLRLESLVKILDGEILVQCHSYRADEIVMLLRVFKEFGVKFITFQHVLEGYKVAKELKEFGAMASTFSDWWAYKFEVYYATAYNASIMNQHGIVTSINSDSPELVRHLNLEAAKSIRYGGMSVNDALKMITINPAKQLGIDKWVGTLEVGKDADIAIFKNHPMSAFSLCEMTLVDGEIYFNRKDDPDDMRLNVSPFEVPGFDSYSNTQNDKYYDSCLEGIEE